MLQYVQVTVALALIRLLKQCTGELHSGHAVIGIVIIVQAVVY